MATMARPELEVEVADPANARTGRARPMRRPRPASQEACLKA